MFHMATRTAVQPLFLFLLVQFRQILNNQKHPCLQTLPVCHPGGESSRQLPQFPEVRAENILGHSII